MRTEYLLVSLFLVHVLFVPVVGEETVDFNSDVKPILSDRCFVCHGPDEENRQADLRLDLHAGMLQEAGTGDAPNIVTPGETGTSELWLRVSSSDPDLVMPPSDSKLKLTSDQIETLRKWIQQGAPYEEHWAFRPIAPPAVVVAGEDSVIDHLIQAKLKQAGFAISNEAGKAQLIRRLSFDLTGLPPSTIETGAFVADVSEGAYSRLVDRLLESTRYGERMASAWLDVARYSDTYGYQVDRDRFVWPYRDWVIRAFNGNLSYDQFLTQQLAGDLLPNATDDQILATTFNRLHPQKVEGGSVPEEFRIEYVADRTQTFATSMLGLTLECARCHDHKFDPVLQKEYYQLTAFFDKIDEAGLYSYFTPSVPTPTLTLGTAEAVDKRKANRKRVFDEETRLETIRRELASKYEKKAASRVAIQRPEPIEHLDFEDLEPSGNNRIVEGVHGKAVRLSGDDGINLKQGNFHRYDPFSISLWLKMPEHRERAVVFHRSRAWTDAGSRGYQCLIEDGRLSISLIHFWPGNAIRVRAKTEYPVDQWHHITMTYDGSSRAAGLRLFIDGAEMPTDVVRDNLYKDITGGGNDHITIGERFRDLGLKGGEVDDFEVFDRQLSAAEVRHVFDNDRPDTVGDRERAEHLLVHDERFQKQLSAVHDARKTESEDQDALQEIMVMREMRTPRDTYVLGRGAYDNRTTKVTAATPGVLPEMDSDLPRNRLGLARWLTNPNHPLTARVAVNRIWQLLFGRGLVRTPEDFGSQGQLPTHPKLLDWLAKDFIDHGWDTKRLIKQLVTSQTYRQSSVASAALLELDPENRLYGRAPSYRWPAEMLRDQALAVSGLLVEKTGGPPAKPYDLEVSFKPAKPDEGEGLYRRSVYTYWKRTGPAPAMMALDAAKRDVCRVKRSRTSSPLQTLVLMNGPQFVEAARSLAENVLKEQAEVAGQLDTLFQTMTGRKPNKDEGSILLELYNQQINHFHQDAANVSAYLSMGQGKMGEDVKVTELAALAAVANTLFGLDECMMKR